MKPAIEVKNLSKSYVISHQKVVKKASALRSVTDLLKKPLGGGGPGYTKETFWALNDVSFQVQQGEIFGVVGQNGSGKSTLLKILSRIVDPTKGEVTMHGRVASLLEVGTGFHPELTGRENVFLNGSLLGLSRREIISKFNDIVEFSEIERFLDTPVKFYSSGMYVRLAFAVASQLEPDILIIDEVLAVGDAEFQKKCMNKITSIASEGKTILFVSHSMGSVNDLCDRAMLLQKGKVVIIGDTETVTDKYLQGDMPQAEREALIATRKEGEDSKNPPPAVIIAGEKVTVRAGQHTFFDFSINGKTIDRKIVIPSGKKIAIETTYSNKGTPRDLLIGYSIKNILTGDFPVFTHNKLENAQHLTGESGKIKTELHVPKLAPGEYKLDIHVWLDNQMFLENEKIGSFRILETPTFSSKQVLSSFPSSVLVDSAWSFEKSK